MKEEGYSGEEDYADVDGELLQDFERELEAEEKARKRKLAYVAVGLALGLALAVALAGPWNGERAGVAVKTPVKEAEKTAPAPVKEDMDSQLAKLQEQNLIDEDFKAPGALIEDESMAPEEPEKGGPAADGAQNPGHGWIIVNQQIPGRGAHEDLDARHPFEAFQNRQLRDILPGAANIKGEVAKHPVTRPGDLVLQGFYGGGRGIGVGHFKDAGDAPHDGGTAAGFKVFFVFVAGLAKMNLGIDHPRQHMQALQGKGLSGFAGRDLSDLHNSAIADGNIGLSHAIMVDHPAPLQDKVVGFTHMCMWSNRAAI